jgi:hypothetical protein
MSQTSWGEIEDLLLAARQRSGKDRARFIRGACLEPALCDALTTVLDDAAYAGIDASALTTAPEAAPSWTDTRVGPYVVLHRLGRGGMGEVFLARDTRLDRHVALKCLVSSSVTPQDLRTSIVREARVAARINHPHVAAVHDVIEHGGRMFMVMEHVEGETLAALLKRGALPSARVVQLGCQMADALAAAHRAGIIHRDLKPANIQVTPDGSIKILDFGIATAYAAFAATTRTSTGAHAAPAPGRAGTRGYMSPEQILGRTVDERSDVFSLSLVLFEMVTGRGPFESLDSLDVLLATVRGLPRAEAPHVPVALTEAIARGLAADPNARHESAAALRDALAGIEVEPRTRNAWRDAGRVVAMVAALPVAIWMLGRLSSAGYNTTLGRSGPFAEEPFLDYFTWGVRSIVAPCVYAALAVSAAWAVRFVVGIIALWAPAGRRIASLGRRIDVVASRLSLRDPIVLAQALTGLGLLALALVAWRFNHLIMAWGTRVSTDSIAAQTLLPLVPDNENERALYRAVFTVLLVIFTAGLGRVFQLRARSRTQHGWGALAALTGVVAFLLLMIEIPYRTFHATAPVAQLGGMGCYAIGEDTARYLLYCPGAEPSRNKIVNKTDPSLRLTGELESIFTPRTR